MPSCNRSPSRPPGTPAPRRRAPAGRLPLRAALPPLLFLAIWTGGCDFSTTIITNPDESGGGPYTGREVKSVTWNADFTRVDITYEAENCTGGEGDTCDIDAVTLICRPGSRGTVERCDVSN